MEIKNKPQHQNEDYLKHQFLELEIPAVVIAKNNNVHADTIWYWLKKRSIKKEEPKYRDEEWLRNQYIILEKSKQEIVKICKADWYTIGRYLLKFGIPERTISEALKIVYDKRKQNKINIKKSKVEYRNYKNNRILREHNGYLYDS